MLNKKTLNEIDSRPQGPGPAPLLAAATVLASLGAFMFSSIAALAVLVVGAALSMLIYMKRLKRRTVPVDYDLEEEEASRFAEVRHACEALAASEKICLVGDGLENPRDQARLAEMEIQTPPGVSTNVEVWRMDLGDSKLFFMPDSILLQDGELYRAISYASFNVAFAPEHRLEEGEAPSDAEVTGQTWQHVRKDGSPDRRRFARNPRLTEITYGRLKISSPIFETRLRVSNRNAAMHFARTLGAEDNGSSVNGRAEKGEEIRIEMAYGILGLQAGSPKAQVTKAYRKLAKLHHPDRMQDLEPEARQLAEDRMRTINDAYSDLKRQPS